MYYVDISNPLWLLVILFVNICFIYLGWKEKNSIVTLIPLLAFLTLLVSHFQRMNQGFSQDGTARGEHPSHQR